MIGIKEVKTKREIKEFIGFPLRLYKGNPCYVPPLYGDEKVLFKRETVYSEQAESVFFIAVRAGETVGRIQGILQRVSNEKWGQKRVRFTRFDCIDDEEVATALFSAVEDWARSKGMEEVVGPLGYSDLDREGLLVEGFDMLSTFEEQYNYPYYADLIENAGYKKEVDWVEYRLFAPDKPDERIGRISDMMMKKYGLKLGTAKNARQFVKKWGEGFFDVLDETYEAIYQSVPFTPKMKKNLIKSFRLVINVRYAAMIVDKDDNIVGFGIAFPAIGEALQRSGGRLTPAAAVRVIKAIRRPKAIDLALIGILPEYRNKAISTSIVNELMKMLSEGGIEYAETNLNLEDNVNVRNQWKWFNAVQHKRRRSYVKTL